MYKKNYGVESKQKKLENHECAYRGQINTLNKRKGNGTKGGHDERVKTEHKKKRNQAHW